MNTVSKSFLRKGWIVPKTAVRCLEAGDLGCLPDCELALWRNWVEPSVGRSIFDVLKSELRWECRNLFMFGRWVKQPRLTCLYGDVGKEYSYSGSDWETHEWHVALRELADGIRSMTGFRPNSVLCNYYRSGQDSVGWHSDLGGHDGQEPTIFSLSLGVPRTFQVKHVTLPEHSLYNIRLGHGDLLKMGAPMQRFWKHQVPKETVRGERINLTFRVIK